MSQKIKLSILIAVWNQEELILRALDSIPRRDDIEVLICDDASTDGTAAAVVRYMSEHPDMNILLSQQPFNRGTGAARNVLIDQASGEYLVFLDSDDWLYADEYQQVMEELDGTDIVFLSFRRNDGTIINPDPSNKDYYAALWMRMLRSDFVGEHRCEALRWAEDKSLSQALDHLPHTEKYTGIVAYHYNSPREGSIIYLRERGFDLRMFENVFYTGHVNRIGGVETFIYELARKYADRDITLLYKTGDSEQLRRIYDHIRVIKWTGQKIRCRKAFFGYGQEALNSIEADEYIQILHADSEALARINYPPKTDPRFTRYIAVSQSNADAFERLTGIRPEVCHNPITLDKPKKVLHLISATRLSSEKGSARMAKLANALDSAGVHYIWTIYSDGVFSCNSPNVILLKPRLDIRDFIADADYLVQLSDTEGYPYSILEALGLGTPVIVTPLPCNPELGVKEGTNAWILPFDMSEIPVEQIAKGLKRTKHKPAADGWADILAPGESTWPEEREKTVTVTAVCRYRDLELNCIFEAGETHTCSWERMLDLERKGLARLI